MNFKRYLDEAKKFAKAKDQDYLADPSLVLSFVETDEKTYKQSTDKTHDSASHAIKHLGEFEPEIMRSTLNSVKEEIKTFLKDNPKQFCGILKKDSTYTVKDAQEAIKKTDIYMLANTLDLINDKVILKKPLIDIEKQLVKFIKKLENAYLDIIKEKMNKAVALDKYNNVDTVKTTINKSDVISFEGWQGTIAMDYVLDFRDNSVILSTPDYIRTLYSFDKPAKSKKDIIKNFFSKRFEVESKIVTRAMKEY